MWELARLVVATGSYGVVSGVGSDAVWGNMIVSSEVPDRIDCGHLRAPCICLNLYWHVPEASYRVTHQLCAPQSTRPLGAWIWTTTMHMNTYKRDGKYFKVYESQVLGHQFVYSRKHVQVAVGV